MRKKEIMELHLAESPGNQAQELIALVSTQGEAEETARLYGIDLVSFFDGVAVYSTTRDLSVLSELGAQNGYPALEPNRTRTLYAE